MIIRLRTLTKKSKIGFGHFKNDTVADVFCMNKQHKLISCYYGLGNISFSEDILDELGITGNLRIEKPGRGDKDKMTIAYRGYWNKVNAQTTDLQRIKQISSLNKSKKIKARNQIKNGSPSKAVLQGIHHGHIKKYK